MGQSAESDQQDAIAARADAMHYLRLSVARDVLAKKQRLGWSTGQLAVASGLSLDLIDRIESAAPGPTTRHYQAVAFALVAAEQNPKPVQTPAAENGKTRTETEKRESGRNDRKRQPPPARRRRPR